MTPSPPTVPAPRSVPWLTAVGLPPCEPLTTRVPPAWAGGPGIVLVPPPLTARPPEPLVAPETVRPGDPESSVLFARVRRKPPFETVPLTVSVGGNIAEEVEIVAAVVRARGICTEWVAPKIE